MTYKDAYMQCNSLAELSDMVEKDIKISLLRIKTIIDTAKTVVKEKFEDTEFGFKTGGDDK